MYLDDGLTQDELDDANEEMRQLDLTRKVTELLNTMVNPWDYEPPNIDRMGIPFYPTDNPTPPF